MNSDVEELESLGSPDEMELKELEIQLSVASLLAMFRVNLTILTLWKDKAFWTRLAKAVKGMDLGEVEMQKIQTSLKGLKDWIVMHPTMLKNALEENTESGWSWIFAKVLLKEKCRRDYIEYYIGGDRAFICHHVIGGFDNREQDTTRSMEQFEDRLRRGNHRHNFLLVTKHTFETAEEGKAHYHVIHDCSMHHGSCRCSIVKGLTNGPGEYFNVHTRDRRHLCNLVCYVICNTRGHRQAITLNCQQHTWDTFLELVNNALQEAKGKGGDKRKGLGKFLESERGCRGEFRRSSKRRRRTNDPIGTSDEKIKGKNSGPRRKAKTEVVEMLIDWLIKYRPTPLKQATDTRQWIIDKDLGCICDHHTEFVDAVDIATRRIMLENWDELLELSNNNDFIYGAKNGDVWNHYESREDSVKILNELMEWNFTDMGIKWVKCYLLAFLNCKMPKRLGLVIRGEPGSGKTFFSNAICDYLFPKGALKNMNKHDLFWGQEIGNKKIIQWEEPNYESAALETLKAIMGGAQVPIKVKHKGDKYSSPTPIICTTNDMGYIFPNDEAFAQRIQYVDFKAASWLKRYTKQIYPGCIGQWLNSFFEIECKGDWKIVVDAAHCHSDVHMESYYK
jgi:Parvovirus non-structural protein NS1